MYWTISGVATELQRKHHLFEYVVDPIRFPLYGSLSRIPVDNPNVVLLSVQALMFFHSGPELFHTSALVGPFCTLSVQVRPISLNPKP